MITNPGKLFLLTCWFPAIALVQVVCLAAAWRTYPHYSMYAHEISDLGDPRHNPSGWLFWYLSMALAGVMLRPVTAYVRTRIESLTVGRKPWRENLVRIGSTTARYSCYGLIALALIPQYKGMDPIHQLAGVFAFGGMYVAVLYFWCLPLWGTLLGWVKPLLATFGAYWGPVGFLVTQGYRFFAYGEIGDEIKVRNQSLLLRFALWEWMLFFCLMTSLVVLVLILPDRIPLAEADVEKIPLSPADNQTITR